MTRTLHLVGGPKDGQTVQMSGIAYEYREAMRSKRRTAAHIGLRERLVSRFAIRVHRYDHDGRYVGHTLTVMRTYPNGEARSRSRKYLCPSSP